MTILRVDLQAQYRAYRAEIDQAIGRVLDSGRYTLGKEVEAFEREFAAYLSISEAIGVADGTRALVLAMRVLGVKPGDEVITTPFTAIPTIGAILEVGAVPVLADIDADTYLIDLDKAAAAVTPRTRAIVPVHMFGNVVDIPALRRRLRPGISIIEDAAQAHGSKLGAAQVGTMGDIGTFSFYPTKNLGCYGDGGAIVTRDAGIAKQLRILRNHGMQDKDICAVPGVNCRLDELQAAILRAKLPHLDAMNAARAALAGRYAKALPANRFRLQKTGGGVTPNWHVFQVRFLGDRDGLVKHLDARGIQSNIYYAVPHHLQPAIFHLGYTQGSLPQTEMLCRQAIALPMYPEMKQQVVDDVAAAIHEFA